MRRHLPALLLILTAVLLALGGLDGTSWIGHPTGDMPDHVWGTWWFGGELLAGRLPLHTAITHLPAGGDIWHPDPLGALLALPLRPLGMVWSWNLLLFVQLLASGISGYFLGFRVNNDPAAGLLAGLATAASPYAIALVHSGLSEYLGLAWPALLILAVRQRREGWSALLLGLCFTQAFYYGAFGLLHCALHGRWRAALGGLALGAPCMALAWSTLHSPEAAFTASQAPGWTLHTLPAVDLASWLRPGHWYHPDTPALGNPGILHVNYLGWILIGLAFRAGRPGWADLAFLVLALGPSLSVNGRPTGIPLPAALLWWTPYGQVHHPYRIAAFVMPLLAVHAGAALSRLPRWMAWGLPLGLFAETLLVSPAPWPIARTPRPEWRLEAGDGPVLDLPLDASSGCRRALLEQVEHGRPIACGVNVYASAALAADPVVNRLLRAADNPAARARNRDVPGPPIPAPGAPVIDSTWTIRLHASRMSAAEAARARQILREAGLAWIEVEED